MKCHGGVSISADRSHPTYAFCRNRENEGKNTKVTVYCYVSKARVIFVYKECKVCKYKMTCGKEGKLHQCVHKYYYQQKKTMFI